MDRNKIATQIYTLLDTLMIDFLFIFDFKEQIEKERLTLLKKKTDISY